MQTKGGNVGREGDINGGNPTSYDWLGGGGGRLAGWSAATYTHRAQLGFGLHRGHTSCIMATMYVSMYVCMYIMYVCTLCMYVYIVYMYVWVYVVHVQV